MGENAGQLKIYMDQGAGLQVAVQDGGREIIVQAAGRHERAHNKCGGQYGKAGRRVDTQEAFPKEVLPGGAFIEALGDQEAAEKKKRWKAQKANMKIGSVIHVLVFCGKDMRVGFHDHQGGYEPDQSEVIPVRILQMIPQSFFSV